MAIKKYTRIDRTVRIVDNYAGDTCDRLFFLDYYL
jgi:hypothetical protein